MSQSGTTTTTSSLTQTLAAGAMMVMETQAVDESPGVSGSAQLTTTGNISAFEIFRWNTYGQEASVPLETRMPGSFVLLFDNTGGTATGVALTETAGLPANITMNIFDDTGVMLLIRTVSFPQLGHTAFMLPDAYPATAGKRGMVEFVVPPGDQITTIGLRLQPSGTMTTITSRIV